MSRLPDSVATKQQLSASIIVMLLVGMLSACGFHLRGVANLPPELQSIQIQADSLSVSQVTQLRQNLEQAGASVTEAGSSDSVQLNVAIKSLPDRNLADSVGANAVVVRVSRELVYSLTSNQGERLVSQRSIRRQQDLTLDNNNPIGIEYEKGRAMEALDRELIIQLILRLEQT